MKRDISLMKHILGKNFTKRNRFTRQCIGESVIALMHQKPYEEITVSDIVKKAGAWFSYNEEKLGQGREKAKEFFETHPEILEEVEAKVREKLAAER